MKGFGKQQEKKIGYILLQPKHNDYLSMIKESKDAVHIAWNEHPSKAMKFPSKQMATQAAKELIKDKPVGYELKICKLIDIGEQFKVEEVDRVIKLVNF
jgi:hypothetical protein